MMDTIARLQRLLVRLADGEWERASTILITTLNNPGWTVRIELTATAFQDISVDEEYFEKSEHDWLHLKMSKELQQSFIEVNCGPENLSLALDKVLKILGD